jgi:hypothetical protein
VAAITANNQPTAYVLHWNTRLRIDNAGLFRGDLRILMDSESVTADGTSKSAEAESRREGRNPFRNLPADSPPTHSRVPIVPPSGCVGISFTPQIGENGSAEELNHPVSEESRHAWRDVMESIFGNPETAAK